MSAPSDTQETPRCSLIALRSRITQAGRKHSKLYVENWPDIRDTPYHPGKGWIHFVKGVLGDEGNTSLIEEYKTFSEEPVASHRASCPHPHDETEEGQRELRETMASLGGALDAWTKQVKLAAERGRVIECLEACPDVLGSIVIYSRVLISTVSAVSEQHDK